MPAITLSDREKIVCAAERLFAERGLDGVSWPQIDVAADLGGLAARHHFASKTELVEAIFAHRLPRLRERRTTLIAQRCPDDLRSWIGCHVVPILEQGEQEGSNYLGFVVMLHEREHREMFDRLGAEFREYTHAFREPLNSLLSDVSEPLRTERISQAIASIVRAGAERERAQAGGRSVPPFATHVGDLLDGLVWLLEAPVLSNSLALREGADGLAWSLFH